MLEPQDSGSDQEQPFPHALFGLGATVAIYVFYILGAFSLSQILSIEAKDPRMAGFQMAGQLLFMLLPSLIVCYASPLGPQGLLRLSRPKTSMLSVLSILLAFVGVTAIGLALPSLEKLLLPADAYKSFLELQENYQSAVADYLRVSDPVMMVISFFTIVIVPPLAEETLFRGVMQRSLEQAYPAARAVFTTAILFTAFHLNVTQSIELFLLSYILSSIAQSTQSLIPSILVHLLNNLISFVLFHMNLPDGNSELQLWQALVLCVAGGLMIWLGLRHTSRIAQRMDESVQLS